MALNELLDAHQRAAMQTQADGSPQAIRVALYAARIRELRDGHGDICNDPIAHGADMLVYAGRSGAAAIRPVSKALESWETDGGAIASQEAAVRPEGITMTLRPEYRVGPYVYTDLALAVAELARQ
jgi:hypothetical protein